MLMNKGAFMDNNRQERQELSPMMKWAIATGRVSQNIVDRMNGLSPAETLYKQHRAQVDKMRNLYDVPEYRVIFEGKVSKK